MFILIRISFVRFIGDFGNEWIIKIIVKIVVKIIMLGWCCWNIGIKLC